MSEWDLKNGKRPQDDDDGRTPFGRKARLWFINTMRERLAATDETHPKPAAMGEELEDLALWYAEEASRYVTWEPADRFAGKGFSVGGWTLDTNAINEDLALGRKYVRRRRLQAEDANVIQSLDEWLRADIAGELKSPGAVGGSGYLPDETQAVLAAVARGIRRNWPKLCVDCRESFRPRKRNAVRCTACLAASRGASRRQR